MIWGGMRKTRAMPAPSTRPTGARDMVRVAVTVLAGLAVTTAAAPALAAQHPARLAGTGQHRSPAACTPAPSGPTSPGRPTYVRHPGKRHPVVLGRQRLR